MIISMYGEGRKVSDIMAWTGTSLFIVNKILKKHEIAKRTKSEVMHNVFSANLLKYGKKNATKKN